LTVFKILQLKFDQVKAIVVTKAAEPKITVL